MKFFREKKNLKLHHLKLLLLNDDQHRRFLRSFTANEPAVRAYVRRLVPTRADADDVMQDIAVVLWEKFAEFRETESFRAWAFGVARYEVLAWRRDSARDRLVLDEDIVVRLAEESADENEEHRLATQRAALDHCLKKVDAEQRDLLMGAYDSDNRIQDVAATSGRTVAGFYQWLHRMRRQLLDCVRRQIREEAG